MTFNVLLAISVLGAILFSLSLRTEEEKESTKKIEGIDFIPTQMFMGADSQGGLAVNERTHQMCLFNSPSSTPRQMPTADLYGSFLVKNGEILGEGKRSYPKETLTFLHEHRRQQASLITSSRMGSSMGSTQRIDLIVIVNDWDDPILVVNFLDMETKEGGILFEKSLSTATHWHNILNGLILEADQLARLQPEATQEEEMVSAAP